MHFDCCCFKFNDECIENTYRKQPFNSLNAFKGSLVPKLHCKAHLTNSEQRDFEATYAQFHSQPFTNRICERKISFSCLLSSFRYFWRSLNTSRTIDLPGRLANSCVSYGRTVKISKQWEISSGRSFPIFLGRVVKENVSH